MTRLLLTAVSAAYWACVTGCWHCPAYLLHLTPSQFPPPMPTRHASPTSAALAACCLLNSSTLEAWLCMAFRMSLWVRAYWASSAAYTCMQHTCILKCAHMHGHMHGHPLQPTHAHKSARMRMRTKMCARMQAHSFMLASLSVYMLLAARLLCLSKHWLTSLCFGS